MRIATWNVNSLKSRLERVISWLERAAPDILFIQETKLTDAAAPREVFTKLGYHLTHHGEGGRNGVAVASRAPITDLEINFGEPLRPQKKGDPDADYEPLSEARFLAGVTSGIPFACLYAPNGRVLDSRFYEAKLSWFDRLSRWIEERSRHDAPLLLGGDFNITPSDSDVWNARAAHGGTHVSPKERAAFARLIDWGLVDTYRIHHDEPERYTWWDYRAGDFYKNFGMRIDHLLMTKPLAARVVGSEIDREARKGKPTPSDHAPLVVDLDEHGKAFDAGWESAAKRIAERRAGKRSE